MSAIAASTVVIDTLLEAADSFRLVQGFRNVPKDEINRVTQMVGEGIYYSLGKPSYRHNPNIDTLVWIPPVKESPLELPDNYKQQRDFRIGLVIDSFTISTGDIACIPMYNCHPVLGREEFVGLHSRDIPYVWEPKTLRQLLDNR